MSLRKLRSAQNRPNRHSNFPGGGFGAKFRSTEGRCVHCRKHAERMPLDLAGISGYAVPAWEVAAHYGTGRGQVRHHLWHIAEAVLAEKDHQNGSLGSAFVTTFETALDTVKWVIDEAKKDKNFAVILAGAKVAAELAEMQGKIEGSLPIKSNPIGRPRTNFPEKQNGQVVLTADDVKRAMADQQATAAREVEEEADEQGDPPADL